jgi:hypothetical protein
VTGDVDFGVLFHLIGSLSFRVSRLALLKCRVGFVPGLVAISICHRAAKVYFLFFATVWRLKWHLFLKFPEAD